MLNNSIFVLDLYFLKWVLVHGMVHIILKTTRGLTQKVADREIWTGINKDKQISQTVNRFACVHVV
jgi:hypothetical protein